MEGHGGIYYDREEPGTTHHVSRSVGHGYILNRINIRTRHDNGTGRGQVLSPQFPTPTLQHVPLPVPDTRWVKIYYPIPVPVGYRVSSTPSRTQFKLEK